MMCQELCAIIQSTMGHTHCAGGNSQAQCMQGLNPLSTKTYHEGYPCQFQPENIIIEYGYSLYCRRHTGLSFTLPVRTGRGNIIAVIEKRRVVPYTPYFSLYYKAHINVEVCRSVGVVK